MNASIPMKPYDFSFEDDVYVADSLAVEADSDRLSGILDAKYAPTDIAKYVSEQKPFSIEERSELFNLMKAYEGLFDGTLGQWTGEPHHIELIVDRRTASHRVNTRCEAISRSAVLRAESVRAHAQAGMRPPSKNRRTQASQSLRVGFPLFYHPQKGSNRTIYQRSTGTE
jgi:hypothetical protein